MDGFNYHGASGGVSDATSLKVAQIACSADWNGWSGGGTNNGSTLHEYARAVRVNGLYRNNADRSIHDINHAMSWKLGCVAGPSFNAVANPKANWVAGLADGAAEDAKLWLGACQSIDGVSDYDLYAWSHAQIRYANMAVGGFVNGGTGSIGP